MKITGTIKDIVPELLKLEMDKLYICEIKQPKLQRSLQQNRLLWKLIHSIAKETYQEDMDVYCAILEKADALSDYVITAIEMEDALRKSFRGVKFIRTQEVNGKECYVYKVYIGSSKMSTKEMTELLEITLQICGDLGIEVCYD
jgi:hypothetical protein